MPVTAEVFVMYDRIVWRANREDGTSGCGGVVPQLTTDLVVVPDWRLPDGTTLYPEYADGAAYLVPNGTLSELDPCGDVVSEYTYVDGVRHGEARSYGTIAEVVTFANDVLHGPAEHYVDGDLAEAGSYANGVRSGLWRTYDSLGNLSTEGPYENDLKHGDWVSYDDTGAVAGCVTYVSGVWSGACQ
jgi:hypothetical protein